MPVHQSGDNDVVDYFNLEELSRFSEYVEKNKQFIVDKDFDEYGKEKVIYFKSKGYQRKGMRDNFYSDFKNDGLYFDLPSIIKAYGYLEADHHSTLDELQTNFKENFINNFVEGESIFHVSW